MLKFSHNYPLSQVTTLGIGGPAKLFVAVETPQGLVEAIQYAKVKGMNYLVIGGGSNLLVADEGVNCLVIKNEITGIARGDSEKGLPARSRSEESSEDARWDFELAGPRVLSVKSGTILQDLVDYSIAHSLSGLQKLTGIPGTVGGAVYGNAGAYGQTISDHITSVIILGTQSEAWRTPESRDSGQARVTLGIDQCGFNYRDSGFKRNKYVILEVIFQLDKADPQTLQKEAEEVLKKRLIKYPKGIKCPGSFFKNIVAETLPKNILAKIPPTKITYGKISAGYLLEAVGAQGQSLDGIEIAPYHANLFINKDKGSAQAFYDLAKKYAQKVKEKFGITLESEVQLVNLSFI